MKQHLIELIKSYKDNRLMMIDLKDHEETDDAMRVELTARINIIECKIKAAQSRLQLLNHKPILSEGQYPNIVNA
jgi:hypothetical protein